jgi:hypothetical protein
VGNDEHRHLELAAAPAGALCGTAPARQESRAEAARRLRRGAHGGRGAGPSSRLGREPEPQLGLASHRPLRLGTGGGIRRPPGRYSLDAVHWRYTHTAPRFSDKSSLSWSVAPEATASSVGSLEAGFRQHR